MAKKRVEDLGEFSLIEILTRHIKNRNPNIIRDFGDDTAFIREGERYLLLTVDTMVEGVHFLKRYPPSAVGWKLVSVNVSDIAAKGGKPLWSLITLSLPPDTEVEYLENLYKGISQALEFYRFSLVGGNTTSGEKLCFDLSLVGEAKRAVFRDTPMVGDKIYVSGPLGDSLAGLELLLEDRKIYEPHERKLIERHLKPTARVDLAPFVERYANASMDISDGLVSDLAKMCKTKRAVIFPEKIPLSEELKLYCSQRGKNPVYYALKGGEDYQLLVSSRENLTTYGFHEIGYIASEGKGEITDEKGKRLNLKGFEHFRG